MALLDVDRHGVEQLADLARQIGGVLFVMAQDSVFLGRIGRLAWGPTVQEKMRAEAITTGKPALFVVKPATAIAALERLDEGSGRAEVLARLHADVATGEVHVVTSIAGTVELHQVRPGAER